MAAKAQTHTHTLAHVGVMSIHYNLQALITRDKEGKTSIDIARRSGACAEIIGLLSLTPEEARKLGWKGMARLYAPVAYWRHEMLEWIKSRSWADCHKFINEHDEELVHEVLKFRNSELLLSTACNSQVYSDSLVFFALRMIHRNPLALTGTNSQGYTPRQASVNWNACREIQNVLRLSPIFFFVGTYNFPTLLRQHLPKQFVDSLTNVGTFNTVCQFIRHMKYDKAELNKVEDVLKKPTPKCDVCKNTTTKACARCRTTSFCSAECQKSAWKKHKKTCKRPTTPPATEADLRTLHKGMNFLNRCIQEPGAGDGPTSVVVEFLFPNN